MKVALVLTGYMRNWETHYQNIYDNIIKKYNTDVYITSYTYSELYKGSGIIKLDVDNIINTYKPKNFLFREKESLPKFKFKKNGLEINSREWSYRILKQWYTIYLGLSLFEFDDYDIIIKCRSDFSTKNFKMQPEKNIVIPAWKVHPGPCEPEDSYIDYFAYGKSKYMKKYFSLYEKIQELHDNDWGDVSLGETLIKSYLDRYVGKQHIKFDYDMDWMLRNEMWATDYRKLYEIGDPEKLLKVPATEKDALSLGDNLDNLFLK